jgi:hypothetical protein
MYYFIIRRRLMRVNTHWCDSEMSLEVNDVLTECNVTKETRVPEIQINILKWTVKEKHKFRVIKKS